MKLHATDAPPEVTEERLAILAEFLDERCRGIAKGYTPEHDAEHSAWDLCDHLAEKLKLLRLAINMGDPQEMRRRLIQVGNLTASFVEWIDAPESASDDAVPLTPEDDDEYLTFVDDDGPEGAAP